MKIRRALAYFLREAASDIWKRRKTNLVSVATIGATLYIAGLFLFAMANMGRVVSSWAQESRISVYLSDTLDTDARTRLSAEIDQNPVVKSTEYVSKDEALRRFKTGFPDLADLAVGLDENPLPASLEILMKKQQADPQAAESLAAQLRGRPGVEGVRYDLDWVRRVRSLLSALTWVGAGLGGMLFAAAVITISGVIRLNVHARRAEIEILRLVGATRGFIRGPFLVEGAFQGLAASLFAITMIGATWIFLTSSTWVKSDALVSVLRGAYLPLWAPAVLLAIGLAAGLVGSLFSVRRVFTAAKV